MTRFTVAAAHPAIAGHFPGRPVVPGVLLLDAVREALRARDGAAPGRLLRAKFASPVAPGEAVEVELGPGSRFACRVGTRLVLRGEWA